MFTLLEKSLFNKKKVRFASYQEQIIFDHRLNIFKYKMDIKIYSLNYKAFSEGNLFFI
jgi:hypothetical protein